MKSAGFAYLIKKSFSDTHQFLFRPFSINKWAALLIVALFAGVLSGGFNFGLREQVKNRIPSSQTGVLHSAQRHSMPFSRLLSSFRKLDLSNAETSAVQSVRKLWDSAFGKVAFAFLSLIFFIAPWLMARFSFVWLHDIQYRTYSIKEPFERFRPLGNSFFFVELIVNFAFVILIASGVILLGSEAHWSFRLMARTMEFPVLILTLLLISTTVFNWIARDFIVPIMAVDSVRFWQAWNSFVSVYRKNRGDFWSYLLVTAGLKMVAGMIGMLAAAIWLLAIIVSACALFFVPYLVFNVLLMQLEFVFWCYAVLVGLPFVFLMVASSLAVNLPFAVFFRFFSLYFLSSLDSNYRLLKVESDEN